MLKTPHFKTMIIVTVVEITIVTTLFLLFMLG
jgi:hypothetical protein